MTIRNRLGLPRHIPTAVKREVRQRCGFGCVICGLGFYDYEHFAPDFADADAHRPEGITLLCMQCNQKRRRGTLSRERVAAADRNPMCLQAGFTREYLDVAADGMTLQLGTALFHNCPVAVEINRFPVLTLRQPEVTGEPLRVSGYFCDSMGRVTLIIRDNEWKAPADLWDIECIGPRIKVKATNGPTALVLRTEPPHRLVVEQISMVFEGVHVVGDEQLLKISLNNGQSWSTFGSIALANARAGLVLANNEAYMNSNDLVY